MRKVTQQIIWAFEYHREQKIGNSYTDGKTLYLHGNAIAEHRTDGLWITNAGWTSNVTKERLNGLRDVSINQKNYAWFLNGKEWDGKWIRVSDGFQGQGVEESLDKLKALKNVASVMALGNILGGNQKEKNDWKTRMLKAGLEGRGLIMPEDWNELDEATKEARLNAVIESLK